MNDKALPPAWTGQLAQHLHTSAGLSPEAGERIKRSLMQKISALPLPNTSEAQVRNIRLPEGWVQLSKRMQVKVLNDDGVHLSWLLKLLPGGSLPAHDHADGAEECMVLEGSLRLNGELFKAGDYQIALPGSVHHEVASDEGSLVFLRSPASRRKDLMGA
jgi:quercetin dioxygenase-like cupin family protein